MKKIIKNKLMWSTGGQSCPMMYSCSDSFLEVPPTGALRRKLVNWKIRT